MFKYRYFSVLSIFSLLSLFSFSFVEKIFTNTSNLQKNIIYSDDFQTWEDAIKNSSENEHVKVFFQRPIAFGYQQSLIATNYMLQSNDNRNEFDNIVWFIDKSWFNYDYDYHINKYGNNETSSKKYNFSVFTKASDIPNYSNYGFYSETEDEKYSIIPTEKILGTFLEFYLSKKQDIQFDLWLPEISLEAMWKNGKK